jgi:uncharacterized protein
MPKIATDPPKSAAQKRLMEGVAHNPAFAKKVGIKQSVGKEFVGDQRPSAGLMITTPEGHALFMRRSKGSDHPGTWAWPAGGIENGETAEEAARRETSEETGYAPEGSLAQLDHKEDDEGAFTTFHHGVDEPFTPRLDREHTAYSWAPLEDPPSPLHPGVQATLDKMSGQEFAQDAAFENFAFDRASVRRHDVDGRMHVDDSNISKANVCPYLGSEIPNWQGLKLNPKQIYQLYRDPDELEKAASTFNNLPILSKHVEVNAANHRPDLLIGTTGSTANFDKGYLKNSLAFWVLEAIEDIQQERKEELSSAYRYRADMTPGVAPDGTKFDGVMRDIIGNHVALVEEGRAGPDVMVGDSKKELNMKLAISQKAMMVRGAVASFIAPRLAADAKMPALAPLLLGLTGENFKEKKPKIAAAITKAIKPLLAKDASAEGLAKLLDHLEETPVQDDMDPEDDMVLDEEEVPEDPGVTKVEKPNPMEALMAFLQSKLSPEDMAQVEKLCGEEGKEGAEDEPVPFKGMPKPGGKMAGDKEKEDKEEFMDKPAMDAAIAKARKDTLADATKNFQAIRLAERAVFPYVGEVTKAFDSASDVYKHALEAMKVDIKGVDVSAYPAMLKLVPVVDKKTTAHNQNLGMDAANASDFEKRFPNAKRIING